MREPYGKKIHKTRGFRYNIYNGDCVMRLLKENKIASVLKRAVKFSVFAAAFFITLISVLFPPEPVSANAQPFYAPNPSKLVLIGKFSTSYANSDVNRSFNISLAAKKINGTFIESGEAFSFNKTVGPRTEKNGFKPAKIIVGGKFDDGIGGGVCQVSTTVYNAAVFAGLKIKEYHPHSLSVSYVEPSADAMVSYGYADLKVVNSTKNPLYIRAFTKNKTVTVAFYGEKSSYTYKYVSVVKETLEPESGEVIIDDGSYGLKNGERKVLAYPKKGIKSEAYLYKYEGKTLVSKTLVRRDFYKPVRGVTVISGEPLITDGDSEKSE